MNPDDVVEEHGADALRLYEMFMGPLEAVKPWQTSQVSGVVRFRNKVHTLASQELLDGPMDAATERLLHKTMKKVTGDMEVLAFNTAISALMVLTNHLASLKNGCPRAAVEKIVLMVSPIAPHLGEECWSLLGHDESLATAPWVTWDESLCEDVTAELGVQVNGKRRGSIELAKDASQVDATNAAMALPRVSKHVDGKPFKKVVYVPGRILNIIV